MRTCRHPASSPYGRGLDRGPANHAALTPLAFLERAADVHPDRLAVLHGPERTTYAELRARCRRLASALAGLGVAPGDTVAILCPNTPAMVEAHHGVPMAGAVLNALNTRLDPGTVAHCLGHGRAKVLLADTELSPLVAAALARMDRPPPVVDVCDPQGAGEAGRLGALTYEELLAGGSPDFDPLLPEDEWQAIALNYTSGTTGRPKGVVYHHRGAYLNAVGNALVWDMPDRPVYLWTLPMFHCNGWCFPWAVCLRAGTHVCLRKVEAGAIWASLADAGVTHLCGAPVVMGTILNAPETVRRPLPGRVRMMTAAAAPPAAVLERMAALGFDVTHVYGLTEVYGPATVCAPQEAWEGLPPRERAERLARQGVRYPVLDGLEVAVPATLEPVPRDGASLGEILMRGHIVMKGYLEDAAATAAAFAGGWFRTGDLAVRHPDGYVEIKDRSKDIIITGGENVSSIEVEAALYRHPDVLEAAVVATPDPKWGETPCAFVLLREGATAGEAELLAHCRGELAGFQLPRRFVFGPLPKTSTGKVQKAALRERAKAGG